ncbi:hypothetical protein ABZR71_27835 [Pseudomonas paraeruginosa]|uniref:hypothetical protein n=1 Tax=Pseudomonas aeruginosa group TaxID=136841 RepID=UPI00071B4515|nr:MULTISPECIES: hypothetical protein [Pseudomonas aeruginosa group]KSF68788.1 hypothetical protein AO940_26595 [Pseudomonas aeruginosa]PTC33955.1 hypothetical protein CLJ1_5163 [Pseudomonas aeruginosa]
MPAAPLASVPLAPPAAPCLLHRVRFSPGTDSGGLPLLARLYDPQPALALLAQRSELAENDELPATAGDDELLVVFASAGLQTGHAWRQRLEAWMAAAEGDRQPTLEAPSFGERVLWRPGRALIIGNPERCRELLDGLVAFAWYESRLRRLEDETAAAWEPAQADIKLTQLPRAGHLSRQAHVNEQVRRTTLWRMGYTRLESHLEKAPAHLDGAVRRLYNELALQAEVHDRLATLDDRIEVLQDLYELATDRLGEYRYFRGELRVEWLIVALLLLEAALSLWEFLD